MWGSKNVNLFTSTIVGLTFVFSGMAKLNDPLGFADKIEEYLHVFANQFSTRFLLLLPYTLVLAVLMATLEFVLGTSLIVHFQLLWTLRALLLLMLFFTGLTLYTATFTQVASCGCFGDALSLTPWQSFGKSVLLLLLLGWLYWQKSNGEASNLTGYYWIATALLFALGLSWYTIHHLPVIDFQAYKVGNNLAQLTQPSAPLHYVYVVEKEGRITETDHYPEGTGYRLVATRLTNPDNMPAITTFNLWRGANDCTAALLAGDKLLIIAQHPTLPEAPKLFKLQLLVKQLNEAVQPIFVATSSAQDVQDVAEALQLPLHLAAATLLKTMLRAKLGLLLLSDGVIVGKWHYNDLDHAHKALKKLGLSKQ